MDDAHKTEPPISIKPEVPRRLLVVVVLIIFGIFAFWYFQEAWHYRDNLPKEYEQIFATPFNKVDVTEYWNASAGHGTKFSFLFHSTVPVEIKNESLYEKTEAQEMHRYPWATTSLYLERQSGDVTILLDRSRRTGHIRVQTPLVCAVTREGKRLYRLAKFPWPNELTQIDEAWNEGWAKREEAKGFQFRDIVPGESLIFVTHIMNPCNFSPEEFERQIRQYLGDLEGYNPEDVRGKVTEKLLEVHVPDRSLSEGEVQALSKITSELSANYAEPFDGKTWRIKSRNGAIPVRLKVFVHVTNLKY